MLDRRSAAALSDEDLMLSRYSYLTTVNKAWRSGISQMTKIDQVNTSWPYGGWRVAEWSSWAGYAYIYTLLLTDAERKLHIKLCSGHFKAGISTFFFKSEFSFFFFSWIRRRCKIKTGRGRSSAWMGWVNTENSDTEISFWFTASALSESEVEVMMSSSWISVFAPFAVLDTKY